MEMTVANLLHRIARLRMENLELQQQVQQLKAQATAATAARENQPGKLAHRPEAHEARKRRRAQTGGLTVPHSIPYHLETPISPARARAH